MRPIITIGIPVYNVEQYIEKALLSALTQSFSLPYEILVIDDKGTDNSMSIVNDLKQSHPRGNCIRIIEHSENKGVGEARNTAIDNAKGEYLFFLDSDDWMDKDILSVMYAKAKATKSELVVGDVTHVYGDELWQRTHYKENEINHLGAGAYAISHKIEDIHQEWWGKLWSVEFLRRTNIRCLYRVLEDIFPQFRMCAETQRISWVSHPAIFYRIRPDSIMTSQKGTIKIDAYLGTISEARKWIVNQYSNVDGIYDMYIDRVRDAIANLSAFQLTEGQEERVAKELTNFMNIVPNIHCLHNKHNKLFYVLCKHNTSYKHAIYAIKKAPNTLWGRVLRNILR